MSFVVTRHPLLALGCHAGAKFMSVKSLVSPWRWGMRASGKLHETTDLYFKSTFGLWLDVLDLWRMILRSMSGIYMQFAQNNSQLQRITTNLNDKPDYTSTSVYHPGLPTYRGRLWDGRTQHEHWVVIYGAGCFWSLQLAMAGLWQSTVGFGLRRGGGSKGKVLLTIVLSLCPCLVFLSL